MCSGFFTPKPSNDSLRWYQDLPAGALSTPALAVVGSKDTVTPPHLTDELAERFTGAQVHVVAGGRHAMPQKAGDVEVVHTFLARVAEARGSGGGGS